MNSKTVLLYTPIFKTGGYAKALLKFIILLKNILKGQNLIAGPQIYAMMHKLLEGYSFQCSEHKYQEYWNKTMN